MFACAMFGAPITGSFGTNGAGVLTFATGGAGGANYIDFCPTDFNSPNPGPSSCVGAAGYGLGDIEAVGGTGIFTAVNPVTGIDADILDLVDSGVHPPFTTFPVGGLNNINNFIRLDALPNLNFIAQTFVQQPACFIPNVVLCAGGFVLTQSGQNVSVTATINGRVVDTNNVLTDGLFTDILSGQFTNTDILTVAGLAASPTGIFSNTWSNSVTVVDAAVPEPGTFGLLGGALVLIGSFSTRLRRRK
jgi:hypothetical protein